MTLWRRKNDLTDEAKDLQTTENDPEDIGTNLRSVRVVLGDIVTEMTINTNGKEAQRIVAREGMSNVIITDPVTAQVSRGRAVATSAGGVVQTDLRSSEVLNPVTRVASGSHEIQAHAQTDLLRIVTPGDINHNNCFPIQHPTPTPSKPSSALSHLLVLHPLSNAAAAPSPPDPQWTPASTPITIPA